MARHNVGSTERWVSGLGGGTLILWGLRRASLPGLAIAAAGAALAWRGLSGWCNLYGALGIDRAGGETGGGGTTVGNLGVKIDRSIVVAAPPERLYRFWRKLENLPRLMSHLDRVETLSATRSRWHIKAPGGLPIAWEAEIINDHPPTLIAWRTASGAPVSHAGSVRFVPEGSGTRVDVSLQYDPPGGTLAHEVAALMGGDAGTRIEHDLEEFKRALESGRLAA
jgi:uncharacterized membrane protein